MTMHHAAAGYGPSVVCRRRRSWANLYGGKYVRRSQLGEPLLGSRDKNSAKKYSAIIESVEKQGSMHVLRYTMLIYYLSC